MFRAFRSARRKSSQFALALALAGGAAVGTAAIAPAAMAQDYSSGFIEVYQPTADLTQGETPDYEAARARLDAVHAAVETDDDRMAAGNLTVILGNQLDDGALRRTGLEMMIASGKVAPEQLGQFHFYVASYAYNAGDYAAARAAIEAAIANGYVDTDTTAANDHEFLLMKTYVGEDNPTAGLAYILGEANKLEVAGQPVPESWLLQGLQDAYNANLTNEATDVSLVLLRQNPSKQNWTNTLQVANALNELEPSARVDLFRLMLEADAMTQRGEYIRLVEDLDPRIMGSEVITVLDAGVASGQLDASDPYYVEVRGIAEPRAAADRREKAATIAEGESGDARMALTTGDVLYSLGDYAEAERFYETALERGFDSNTANTRIGITLVKQGDYAAAQEAFGQVSGARTPVAKLWSAYAESLATQ